MTTVNLVLDVVLSQDDLERFLTSHKGCFALSVAGKTYEFVDESNYTHQDIEAVRNGIEPKVFAQIYIPTKLSDVSFKLSFADCSLFHPEVDNSVEVGTFEIEDITPLDLPKFPFETDFEIFVNEQLNLEIYKAIKNKRTI